MFVRYTRQSNNRVFQKPQKLLFWIKQRLLSSMPLWALDVPHPTADAFMRAAAFAYIYTYYVNLCNEGSPNNNVSCSRNIRYIQAITVIIVCIQCVCVCTCSFISPPGQCTRALSRLSVQTNCPNI